MRLSIAPLLPLALLASSSPLLSRGLERCKNLQAASNNGGRKMAIVIDESGSMDSNDPYNLRIDAGKAVNDWLISSSEAGNGKAADQVTVIGFDDETRLLYSLGDPSGADSVFSQITTLGGTYIAGGVDEAISQLTGSGAAIANSSGIVVLTDGSDSSTSLLVESIDNAGQKGIRVSFGFLDSSGYSFQDPEVLKAIHATGGFYATINGDKAQNAFANVLIVHGLADNDNPNSKTSTAVYNGLSVSFMLGEDGSSTLTYAAEAGESLTFAVSSLTAGDLEVTAMDAGGKEIGKTSVPSYSYGPEELAVKASGGSLQLKVQGDASYAEGMFIVGVNSSIPLTNCTLGEVKGDSGLSKGAKAGIGIAVPLILGLFAAGSYFAWKYWKGLPPKTSVPPSYPPNQPPMDYKQPYVQTNDLPTPSPQPTNTPPGWSVPPPKFPQSPNQSQSNPQQSNPGQQDTHQHPFNSSPPSQPPQFDPAYPSQVDPSYPTHADPSHPTQADPSHPTQADPSHPTQADPSHPTQADPSHPTQADPSQPTQADPSHPTQADPNPNHPNGTDKGPSQPPQTDPNPPNPNPNDPQDPHAKRLPTPRFLPRVFGRRRKKDDEDQNHHQSQTTYSNHTPDYSQPQTSGGYPAGSATAPVLYSSTPIPGGGVQTQHRQQDSYALSSVTSSQPTYSTPETFGQGQPQQWHFTCQHSSSNLVTPPTEPYIAPIGTAVSPPPQQYRSYTSTQRPALHHEHIYVPQAQYSAPPPAPSPPQQYSTPSSIPLPQSLPGSPPPGPTFAQQQYRYTSTTPLPQHHAQQGMIQQFPQPPPSAGSDQVSQAREINRSEYHVSPILQHAEPTRIVSSGYEQREVDVVRPQSTSLGSVSRKPVGGQ